MFAINSNVYFQSVVTFTDLSTMFGLRLLVIYLGERGELLSLDSTQVR